MTCEVTGRRKCGNRLELPLYTTLCKAMAYKEAEALKFASIPRDDPHSSPGLRPYNWLSLKLLFLQRFQVSVTSTALN